MKRDGRLTSCFTGKDNNGVPIIEFSVFPIKKLGFGRDQRHSLLDIFFCDIT